MARTNEEKQTYINFLLGHNAELKQQNADLVAALERAEQTIRNLGNGFLAGDGKEIALNEAANLRADIGKEE